jgi:hypothetical protein
VFKNVSSESLNNFEVTLRGKSEYLADSGWFEANLLKFLMVLFRNLSAPKNAMSAT